MTESDRVMQVRGGEETGRSRAGKGKSSTKSTKAERPPQQQAESVSHSARAHSGHQQLIARIQERAYMLFEAGGYEHGHALEHWLEAERQITGSQDHSERG